LNVGGGYATFPGVLGTAITQVCEVEIARTGLSQDQADAAGIEYEIGVVEATTRAGYYPGAEPLHAKVLAEKGSGRLIGGQLVGADRAGKRIDTLAAAITARMTASSFVDLDLAYAPAVSPMWDAFQLAARSTLG
ncbi:MAG TPA: flavoprotein oxidoreductase, partial [Acidimicrobiales bacterium]|nr:flavoprotein oxidoreductase [Acidimicrobiales bacterium]